MNSEAARPSAAVGARRRDRWAGQARVLRPGVTTAALDDFGRRYAVRHQDAWSDTRAPLGRVP
jgi:hypothetical protein